MNIPQFQGNKFLNTIIQAHELECQFYGLFRDVNDGFAPKSYYEDVGDENRHGLIIMDDLSERCTTLGIFNTCTKQQFWNAARKIAHFQAVTACKNKDLSNFFSDFHANTYYTLMYDPLVEKVAEYDQSEFCWEFLFRYFLS
jgi:hypothetical protein